MFRARKKMIRRVKSSLMQEPSWQRGLGGRWVRWALPQEAGTGRASVDPSSAWWSLQAVGLSPTYKGLDFSQD